MAAVGYLSFYIGYVTIPLIYLIIGLSINVFYTTGWIIELIAIYRTKNLKVRLRYPGIAFTAYVILSATSILAFPFYLLYR